LRGAQILTAYLDEDQQIFLLDRIVIIHFSLRNSLDKQRIEYGVPCYEPKEVNMRPSFHESENNHDDEDQPPRRLRHRSEDYERKKRRAEAIIERRRLEDLLGFDVDFSD
tara:strand:+ start:8178 stop:8507 length:330 start_codon:yes stop_codon:yes gene_type:complete